MRIIVSFIIMNMDIFAEVVQEISVFFYRVLYFLLTLSGSIMSFIRVSDEGTSMFGSTPKGSLYSGMFFGLSFAAISVFFNSNIPPISVFLISIGVDYYFLFGDSKVMGILKK